MVLEAKKAQWEHARACVAAVEAIGGDPATVAELVAALRACLVCVENPKQQSYFGGNVADQARAILSKLPQ